MNKPYLISKEVKVQSSQPAAQHVFKAYAKGCHGKYGLDDFEVLWFKKQKVSDNFVLSFHISYLLNGEFCLIEQCLHC